MATIGSTGLWLGFVAFILAMLALDLGVFHRKTKELGFRDALLWSGVWIGLALLFNGWLWWQFGSGRAIDFLTGYLIEKSLSVDNIFVFVVIFSAFRVPKAYQHRVLFWGILSALVLRAAMILAGAALLERFHFLFYVFGAFLVFTGVRLYLHRDREEHPEQSLVMRLARRAIPSTARFDGARFFTREEGRRVATPLLMALLLVEASDVLFALDSIPAIFAITTDPFIVFTSNVFAILGLRSLFVVFADLVDRFRYLGVGLAAVLVFVGAKMLAMDFVHVPALLSLGIIAALLGTAVVFSLVASRREAAGRAAPPPRPRPAE